MTEHRNILPRFYARSQQADRDREIARIVRESGEAAPEPQKTAAGATAGGDERRLRGIPVIARGVGGTSPGSNPASEVIARERRRDRSRLDS